MNIGDKVRLLRSNDEGRIIGFKDKNIVEIEIEDGFIIPASRDDIVIISQEEREYFGSRSPFSESTHAPSSTPVKKDKNAMQGMFLGFIPINENDISLYLFNFTDNDILYNISESHGDNAKSLSNGTIPAENNNFITYFKLNNFEKWPEILVQIIVVNQSLERKQNIIETLIKLKAKTFFNSKRIIPKIEKEGYLMEIKAQSRVVVNPQIIKDKLTERKEDLSMLQNRLGRKNAQLVVDLHAEQLVEAPKKSNAEEILDLQLKTFEKELDNAIASGAESIKFIHGIGNGTLRMKIHKFLSQSDNIKYFEDADKGKFGYGATLVHL